MSNPFDTLHDRQSSESVKWHHYAPDVLPMWVADMDFPAPQAVIQALQTRVEHGIFGYPTDPPELRPLLVERMSQRYGWKIQPEDILFVPGVVNGFNMVCHTVKEPQAGVLIQVPVYPPFFSAPSDAGLKLQEAPLTLMPDGRYIIDFDRFEAAITPETRLFLLCNPHNPVGRVFQNDELEKLAQICLRHNLTICSDEIHCDLIFSGNQHIPIASLSPEIAHNTITLMSPSKTFNLAGLKFSFAIVPNPELRKRMEAARQGLVGGINIMGRVAALAAYRDGQPWLDQLLPYLQANRDLLVNFIHERVPGLRVAPPEGTYLTWLDCRNILSKGDPFSLFLERGRIALQDGREFGAGGEGFLRLNFGCPRATLEDGLARILSALE
jgi:cystathionine beta-lyase